MSLVLVTPAATEPVTLATAKLHCKQDLTDDDPMFAIYNAAARRWVEEFTRRQLLTATWRLGFTGGAGWNTSDPNVSFYGCYSLPFLLPRAAPLISVTSVQYTDTAGTIKTLTLTTDYRLDSDSEPVRVWPAYSKTWPVCRPGPSAFAVTYQAGYASAAVIPEPIVQAILLLIAHQYATREAIGENTLAEIPFGVKALLSPFVVSAEM